MSMFLGGEMGRFAGVVVLRMDVWTFRDWLRLMCGVRIQQKFRANTICNVTRCMTETSYAIDAERLL